MRTSRIFSAFLMICGPALMAGCGDSDDDGYGFSDEGSAGKLDSSNLSYGALAATKVPPSFAATLRQVDQLGPNTLPQDAKAPRKQVAETRDFLDLFSFAYPRDNDSDRWKKLRDELDTGYETIGAFKDLFDSQG